MKYITVLLIFFFASSSVFAHETVKIPVQLVKMIDGDTITAKIDDNEFDIRLKGIDCFEIKKKDRAYKQAYLNNLKIDKVIQMGKSSKEFLEKLYNNSAKNVFFEFEGIDFYGRALGYVYFDKN